MSNQPLFNCTVLQNCRSKMPSRSSPAFVASCFFSNRFLRSFVTLQPSEVSGTLPSGLSRSERTTDQLQKAQHELICPPSGLPRTEGSTFFAGKIMPPTGTSPAGGDFFGNSFVAFQLLIPPGASPTENPSQKKYYFRWLKCYDFWF